MPSFTSWEIIHGLLRGEERKSGRSDAENWYGWEEVRKLFIKMAIFWRDGCLNGSHVVRTLAQSDRIVRRRKRGDYLIVWVNERLEYATWLVCFLSKKVCFEHRPSSLFPFISAPHTPLASPPFYSDCKWWCAGENCTKLTRNPSFLRNSICQMRWW